MKNSMLFLTISLFIFCPYLKTQWIEQSLPGDIDVTLGIDFINQNHGVTGGWYGDISQQIYGKSYYTYDAGTNWIEASVPDSMRVMVDVQMINENLGYAAGAYNLNVIKESKRNPIGNVVLSPSLKEHYQILGMDFSGQENYRGYFVETTDGGATWHPKGSFEDSVYYLVGISFIDQQKGFVIASSPGAASNAALVTSDGGSTWDFTTPFQDGIFVRNIKFFEQIGYLIYENSILGAVFITATTDGGITWFPPQQVGLISAGKVTYVNDYTILITGKKNQTESSVFKSTDAGTSWQEIRSYDIQHYLSGVDVAQNTSAQLIYGANISGNYTPFVDISLDGGVTWNYSQLSQFQDFVPIDSKMIDEERWYLSGLQITSQGFVLFTDNSGGVPVELVSFTAEAVDGKVNLSWATATELNNLGFEIERKSESELWRTIGFVDGKGTSTEIQNYSFIDDLFGVTESRLSYRLKQIDFNGTYYYSEEIEVERAPVSFSLEQNYPNPFNPTTSIQYAIGNRQFVSLKVFDLLGNEIATLVNEEKPPGEYEVEFNPASSIENPASGIYFYQLKAGEFNRTRKMVLLK